MLDAWHRLLFTSYLFPTNKEYWEILEDPTGMAERTINGGEGFFSQKQYDSIMAQVHAINENEERMKQEQSEEIK